MEKAREIFQTVRDTDVMTDLHQTTLGQLLGYSDEAIRHFVGEDDSETLKLPDLDVGDELMVGKFKNRNATIKGFTADKHNQPIAKTDKGVQQIFKGRVKKLMNQARGKERLRKLNSRIHEARGIPPDMASKIIHKKDLAEYREWEQSGEKIMPYGVHTYRVTGWYCPRTPPKKGMDDMNQIIDNLLWDTGDDFDKMRPCQRKDATHVTGSGVSGIFEPIENVVVVGRVNWSPEQIQQAKNQWNKRVMMGENAPALKARSARLYEAPVRDFNVGDLDAPYSTFGATDRAMLQSPKAAAVARKRIKTAIPIDINIYTIPGGAPWQKDTDTVYGKAPMQDYSDTSYNQALFNRQLERWSGIMRPDDAEEIIGQPIEVNKDSVNVLYLSNANKITSIPLTPWMMMHRLGHSLEDAARKGHLGGNASEALDDLFGFYTSRMGYMYGASLRQVMTTKAGRDETINDGDTVPELIAQYLHSGRIRLIRPVSYEPTGDEDVAHKFTLSNGKTMFVKGDELDGGDPMKAFTNKLEADERSIAEHINEIVRYAIGLLVVAP